MSHEISDTQYDALQALLATFPCPSSLKWGAKNDVAALSNDDRTVTTDQGALWANVRSTVAHCSGKRAFALDISPAVPNVEEIVAGFGTPGVDMSSGGGGVHGGTVNAFLSWCLADDGNKCHGNEYTDIGKPTTTRIVGLVDFDSGDILLGNETGAVAAFEFTPNTPLYVMASIYVSPEAPANSSVSATLVPGFSDGDYLAW